VSRSRDSEAINSTPEALCLDEEDLGMGGMKTSERRCDGVGLCVWVCVCVL